MRDYAKLVKDLRYCADLDKDCLTCETFEQHDCFNKLGADAADAIEELLAELVTLRNQLPKWVSAEDELPEENKQIISYLAYKGMAVLQYENKHFYMQGAFQPLPKEAVTHWMPLPEPPKGVE
jgi:hypothetical protein